MELTQEQRAIRDLVHEFAVEEIQPVAAECDREARFPEDVWDGLAELDLTGLTVPEEYGGFDADPVTYAIVNEEVAYGMLSVATALSVQGLVASCIAEFGDEAQRERWLPGLAEGRPVGAFCLSETGAGSDPAGMETRARREGDEYVIDGDKQWITNGSRAGVFVVFAKTGAGEITQFVVPGDADGLEVGRKEEKLGLRASDTTSVSFDGVRVPESARLTPEGEGLKAALSILTGGRIGIAAQAVGLAQDALDRTVEYVQEREQFGKPIGDIQAVRHTVAEMATTVQSGRLLTRDAARRKAAGDPETPKHAGMAKYVASEGAMDVTNDAIQMHGGYGYTSEYGVERLYRDAKVTTIYEGTTQIQKTVIARHLLD